MTTPIIDPATLSEEQREAIIAMYSAEKQLELSGETENEKTVGRTICMTLEWLFGYNYFNKEE